MNVHIRARVQRVLPDQSRLFIAATPWQAIEVDVSPSRLHQIVCGAFDPPVEVLAGDQVYIEIRDEQEQA